MELWKKIVGYELYSVSNMGNVRNNTTGLVLKQCDNGKGYKQVGLYSTGHVMRSVSVHRLVALHFIPNPNNYPQVNHKDEDKSNNAASNLEWCTSEYNINYGTHNERVGANNPRRIPIVCVNQLGLARKFDSARDAQRYYSGIGLDVYPAGINKAIKGVIDTYKNMAWFRQDDIDWTIKYREKFSCRKERRKYIRCVFIDGDTIHFVSMADALRRFNLKPSQRRYIREAIDNSTPYLNAYWEYDVV